MHAVAWQPGGSGLLLTASADRTAALWDARSGQCCLRLRAGGAALASADFSPQACIRQGNRVAVANSCMYHACQQCIMHASPCCTAALCVESPLHALQHGCTCAEAVYMCK